MFTEQVGWKHLLLAGLGTESFSMLAFISIQTTSRNDSFAYMLASNEILDLPSPFHAFGLTGNTKEKIPLDTHTA